MSSWKSGVPADGFTARSQCLVRFFFDVHPIPIRTLSRDSKRRNSSNELLKCGVHVTVITNDSCEYAFLHYWPLFLCSCSDIEKHWIIFLKNESTVNSLDYPPLRFLHSRCPPSKQSERISVNRYLAIHRLVRSTRYCPPTFVRSPRWRIIDSWLLVMFPSIFKRPPSEIDFER